MKILTVFTISLLLPILGSAAEATSGPALQISPKPIHFARTTVGGLNYASAIVTDVGTTDLTITKVETYGYDLGNFGLSADGCTGFTAAPGDTCDLELVFGPAHQGLYITWLLIFDNKSASRNMCCLRGAVLPKALDVKSSSAWSVL